MYMYVYVRVCVRACVIGVHDVGGLFTPGEAYAAESIWLENAKGLINSSTFCAYKMAFSKKYIKLLFLALGEIGSPDEQIRVEVEL